MPTIIEIDLDKNLKIPIPEGMTKEELSLLISKARGYPAEIPTNEVEGYKNSTFIGTYEEVEAKSKELNEFQTVVNLSPELDADEKQTGKYILEIFDRTPIANPVTPNEWGIAEAVGVLADFVKEAVITANTIEEEAKLNDQKEIIKGQLDSAFKGLKAE